MKMEAAKFAKAKKWKREISGTAAHHSNKQKITNNKGYTKTLWTRSTSFGSK
jgi:hypothetical protein